MEFVADPVRLLIAAIVGIAVLLVLIIKGKMHAMLALLITALVMGFGIGMPAQLVLDSVSTGITSTMGSIALVVGLGSIFGGILSATGAAETLANTMVDKFGENRAIFAVGLTGLLVGIPVFYDAAFIILFPLAVRVAKRAHKSVVAFVISMVAGVVVGQMIPPTVGPIVLSGILGVDLGPITVIGIIVAIPAWFVVGYLVANFVGSRLPDVDPPITQNQNAREDIKPVKFVTVLLVMLLPIILILLATVFGLITSDAPVISALKTFFSFIGTAWVALLISCLVAIITLAIGRGFTMNDVQAMIDSALRPVATILLVTSCGGVLRYILQNSGTADIIGQFFSDIHMPIVLAAFIITCLVRIAIGSGSVASAMGAGIIAALPQVAAMGQWELAVLAIAICAGSFACSHVNDSGFWLFKECLGMDVNTSLKAWLAYSCSVGVSCLIICLILGAFII